ncbi:Cytochrome P450 monooxygenase andK [Lachnellula arida]|uniref:Cytochrome P450 monooxygenase andK n=1 Tax=Lachnellula arida TaxID=1316785 RepID=A0A8T9BA26_9HELO|nr:Cytochrome P450 monooxygenase andK [Lachnellula arida]
MSPSELPKSPPALHIPQSSSTVTVKVIDSTAVLTIPLHTLIKPAYTGHELLHAPCIVFLIEHASGRKLVFDLGMRKDWENLAPAFAATIEAAGPGVKIEIEKDVAEILQENSVDVQGGAIEGIVWSHWHTDHTGNPALFPSSTSIIVGPGFKENFMPGYPANPAAPLLETDFDGRDVKEVAFSGLEIGGFRANDYFGDGSFYILDCPGHTIGHICALARVTEDTFIFLGADACHHGGEFRPTEYLPLPEKIHLGPVHNHAAMHFCPGSMFEKLSPAANQPFYRATEAFAYDGVKADDTIEKLEVFDALDNVWVVIAHDPSLLEPGMGVDFFPLGNVNGWREKGLAEKTRWRFLKDFEKAAEPAV